MPRSIATNYARTLARVESIGFAAASPRAKRLKATAEEFICARRVAIRRYLRIRYRYPVTVDAPLLRIRYITEVFISLSLSLSLSCSLYLRLSHVHGTRRYSNYARLQSSSPASTTTRMPACARARAL